MVMMCSRRKARWPDVFFKDRIAMMTKINRATMKNNFTESENEKYSFPFLKSYAKSHMQSIIKTFTANGT